MLLLLTAGLALADVAPETGYQEDCLLEYYDADHCASCGNTASEESSACAALAAEGKELACQTWGGSVWDEIWCDPGYTEAIGGPEDPGGKSSSGCGGAKASAGLVLVGAGLLLMTRRRG